MSKVSIITPCYNAEKFISKTIESIRSQTFIEWEYIVVDDGSTDKSVDVVSSYLAHEPRLKLVKQTNAGACNARNNGFKACALESQYLLFFDADDCLEPQMLEVMVEYLDAHPQVGLVYCDSWFIDPENRILLTPEHRRFVPEGFVIRELSYETPQTPLIAVACGGGLYESYCVMRRSIYEQTCGWDEWLGQGTEGVDLFTQIALLSEVHFIPQKLYRYRQYPLQATRKTIDLQKQLFSLLSKWKEGKWLTSEQKKRIDEVLWLFEHRLEPFFNILHGTYLLRAGQFVTAFKLYISGFSKYLVSFLPLQL
ncbi:family 2 glycosyl transferase (plasmid) [Tolypothrix tenuis PCC 7101]|uniref:Family 2 glycosyl transferase n=1 Tax=Tolypothrix tenuis PCC 7101 TaxID=231146 RepID=A0A1Z4NBG9_9CYAN|nr:glycosyltransferase family 2 protein [Aulosira sp. FACHB-113]BAZ03060.1 family 2 glycosyl transferase [Tolypothrix tenuis PCC 7101]BAZ78202.1 family 2 glycosyl transferase [Aulosira laxa NIES-50]